MSSCFVKRVVPFALAFLCGVAAWQLIGFKLRVLNDVLFLEHGKRIAPRERDGTWAFARPEGEGSRTWLVIRANPAGLVQGAGSGCDGCSVSMRVLFGGEGAVPGNAFSLSPSSYPLIEEAVAAARRIEFMPATRNGNLVPVWANVTYACGEEYVPRPNGPRGCRLWVDKDSARTWDGRPWRVIYE